MLLAETLVLKLTQQCNPWQLFWKMLANLISWWWIITKNKKRLSQKNKKMWSVILLKISSIKAASSCSTASNMNMMRRIPPFSEPNLIQNGIKLNNAKVATQNLKVQRLCSTANFVHFQIAKTVFRKQDSFLLMKT